MENRSDTTGDKVEMIEIERKFVIDRQCEDKLVKNGAKLLSRLSFNDEYYDNQSHDLIVNNYWLRCRDGKWQLKCPPQDRQGTDNLNTLQYAEYEQTSEILDHLRYVLLESHQLREATSDGSTEQANASDQLQESRDQFQNQRYEIQMKNAEDDKLKKFLMANNFEPFARFRTQRTKYRVGDDITVDLDIADFGYSVGEIEMMLKAGQPRGEAIQKINDFARELGVYSDKNVPGKLLVYLEKYQSELYWLVKKTFKL